MSRGAKRPLTYKAPDFSNRSSSGSPPLVQLKKMKALASTGENFQSKQNSSNQSASRENTNKTVKFNQTPANQSTFLSNSARSIAGTLPLFDPASRNTSNRKSPIQSKNGINSRPISPKPSIFSNSSLLSSFPTESIIMDQLPKP